MSECYRILRVGLVGDEQVGKSTIAHLIVNGVFESEYIRTCGVDVTSKSFPTKGIKLLLWDMCGHDRFQYIVRPYLKILHVLLFVYSIGCRASFDRVKHLHDNYLKSGDLGNIQSVVVGNKLDFSEGQSFMQNTRQVSHQEGTDFASKMGLSFIEVSARTEFGIEDLLKIIFNHAPPPVQERDECYLGKKGKCIIC